VYVQWERKKIINPVSFVQSQAKVVSFYYNKRAPARKAATSGIPANETTLDALELLVVVTRVAVAATAEEEVKVVTPTVMGTLVVTVPLTKMLKEVECEVSITPEVVEVATVVVTLPPVALEPVPVPVVVVAAAAAAGPVRVYVTMDSEPETVTAEVVTSGTADPVGVKV